MNSHVSSTSRLSPRISLSLKTRIAIAVVAFVLVTTVLVTSAALFLVKRGMKAVISEQQFTLLTRAADEIDQKFYARQASLQALAINVPKKSLNDPVSLQLYLDQNASLKSLFENFLIFDVQGRQLANLNEPALSGSIDPAHRNYIKDTLLRRKGVISAPQRNLRTQRSVVTLTVPVFDEDGQAALILAGVVDLERDNFLGQLAQLKIGRSGYFYVVTGDGTIVTHPNKSHILQNAAAVERNNPALERAFAGFEGTAEGRNSMGEAGLLSFKRLKSANWILAAVYPEEEVFGPIVEVEDQAILAAFLLAIFVGPLAWWITRRQIFPIQQLRDWIQAIGEDPSRAIFGMHYARDEIGDLAQAFDRLVRERLFAEARAQSVEAQLCAAAESSLDAFFTLRAERDEEGRIVDFRFDYINPNTERMLDMTRREVQGKRLGSVVPAFCAEGRLEKYARVIESGAALQEEFAIEAPQIHAEWLHTQVVPLADGVAITMRDITQRKRSEFELRNSRAFLQSLIDQLPALIFVKSLRPENCGQMVVWNKAAEEISGLPAHKVIGKTNREIFPAKMVEIVDRLDQQMLAEKKVIVVKDYPYRRPDGALRIHSSTSVPLFGDDGRPEYMLGIVEDHTERHHSEQALLESEQRLRTITNNLPILIAYVDRDERYRFCNSHYENLLNQGRKPLIGSKVREIIGDEVYEDVADKIATVLAGERVTYERSGTEPDASHWRVDYIPDLAADGTVAGFYVMLLNITSLKQIESHLRSLARMDALTQLANRMHFDEQLNASVARDRCDGKRLALMYLDIDHFKAINDTLGHQAGDEVLREFSRRLTCSVEQGDMVARLAGDEFVIILEGHDMPGDAAAVAGKIIRAMEQGIQVQDSVRQVSTSIGITVLREGETDAEALLRRADEALYAAKSAGRNTYSCIL